MFSDLMNDTVDLLTRDGATHLGLRASVQKKKIFMNAGDLIIKPGDLLRRRMFNGAEETYEVVDPGFHEAFEDFPRHYQIDVEMVESPKTAEPLPASESDVLEHDTMKQVVLAELAEYETKLTAIREGFNQGRDAIWIAEGDAEKLLQNVQEVIDLLDSVLGKPNQYSRQISAYYGHGLQNMYNSPSLQSVRDIVATVKAVQTTIKRPTTVLRQASGEPVRHGNNLCIGHGRSKEWKDLKDFIQDRMRLPWDEFNRVAVAGIPNTVRLATMLDGAAIAFLVLTAEDETGDGKLQARMNVVHEVGLFQGRLGFTKAIVMLEESCEEFSNIAGLGQIRFPKNNIRAAFHDVQLVLEREGLVKSPDE
jgi:hypothetical protein